MASYYFTKQASKDLAQIWNYSVDTWSENQADHYYRMLISSCKDIADGSVYGKQYDGIHPGLLGKKAAKHIIFYRLIDQEILEIVRVLHERMDLGKHLKEK